MIRGQAGGRERGQLVLRIITFRRYFGQLISQGIRPFILGIGAGDLGVTIFFGVGKFRLRLRKFALRFFQFRLGFGQVAQGGHFGRVLVITLFGEHGNLVGHFQIRHHTGAESGQDGHN